MKRAFQALKQPLTSSPILWTPEFDLPFTINTDTSETGREAILFQTFDGEEHAVLYVSWKLKLTKTKYAAVEREALVIKCAIEELWYYLAGQHFTLMTSHAPLQWMARAKDTNTRVTSWFLSLQDFFFQVQHQAGAHHGNVDGLSRWHALWAQLLLAVGSKLGGDYCDGEHSAHIHKSQPTPLTTTDPSAERIALLQHPACFGQFTSIWLQGGAAETYTAGSQWVERRLLPFLQTSREFKSIPTYLKGQINSI